MTGKEFQTWLRGYMEGIRSADIPHEHWLRIVQRIEEEAGEIDAAPVVDVGQLFRDLQVRKEQFPPVPNPWDITPPYAPPYVRPVIFGGSNDCDCDPNSVCGNSACPRAIRFNDVPNTSGLVVLQ